MRSTRGVAVAILFAVIAGIAAADDVGFGLTVGDDFPDLPEAQEVYSRLFGETHITPGMLVFFRDRDWGMSFDFGFDFISYQPYDPVPASVGGYLDFRFATTYDFHPIPAFIIDPFLSVGAAMAMLAPLDDAATTIYLSFLPVAGAGVTVNLGRIYLRGSFLYQGITFAIPSPDIAPYETGPYRVALSAGVLFD